MAENEKKRPEIKINLDLEIENEKNVEIIDDLTAAEQATAIAREQAGEAVDALRRGELIRDTSNDPNASRDDRLIALLCYVLPFVMSAIVLISESSKGRPFQRYHAVQGLGLAIGLGLLSVVTGLFASIMMIIPIIGWFVGILLFCLSPIGFAMGVLAHIYYGYQAYQGKRFSIPGVASFLRSQGWL